MKWTRRSNTPNVPWQVVIVRSSNRGPQPSTSIFFPTHIDLQYFPSSRKKEIKEGRLEHWEFLIPPPPTKGTNRLRFIERARSCMIKTNDIHRRFRVWASGHARDAFPGDHNMNQCRTLRRDASSTRSLSLPTYCRLRPVAVYVSSQKQFAIPGQMWKVTDCSLL